MRRGVRPRAQVRSAFGGRGRDDREHLRRQGLQRDGGGAVHGRGVPDRDPVGDGGDGAGAVADGQQVHDPGGGGGAAGAVRGGGVEVLRGEGRSGEGEVRGWAGGAVALAVPLRRGRVRAADPAGAGEQRRHAGPDRERARAQPALRAGELQERDDPDQPGGEGRGADELRGVLRGLVRPDGREEPGRGRDRVRVGCVELRSVPGAAAGLRRLRDAGLGRARGRQGRGGAVPGRVRADAAARAVRQGWGAERSDLQGGSGDHRRARGAGRGWQAGGAGVAVGDEQLPGAVRDPARVDRAAGVREAGARALGRPPAASRARR